MRVLSGIVAAATIGVPLVATAVLVHELRTVASTSTPLPEAVTAPAVHRLVDDAQPVSIVVTWDGGLVIYSPQWSGTVTEVLARPGDVLEPLDPLVSVDGIRRIAWQSEVWFHRALRLGDSGRDVAELQRLLSAQGRDITNAKLGVFDRATRNAVQQLEVALGVAPASGVFDPSWLVALPANRVTVGTIALTLAAPAPGAGSVLVRGVPKASGATLEGADGPITPEGDGWEVAVAGGPTLRLDDTGHLPQATLVQLEAILPAPSATDGLPAPGTLPASLRRTVSRDVVAVPAAAIVVGSRTSCVFVERGARFVPVSVEPSRLPAEAGVSLVVGPIGENSHVLANPREVLQSAQCE